MREWRRLRVRVEDKQFHRFFKIQQQHAMHIYTISVNNSQQPNHRIILYANTNNMKETMQCTDSKEREKESYAWMQKNLQSSEQHKASVEPRSVDEYAF